MLHFKNERFTLTPEFDMETKLDNTTKPQHDVKLPVSNRLLAEKIILALDHYGRKVHSVEYGLPIDPDTKDFEDKRPQEMLKIVTDILNGC